MRLSRSLLLVTLGGIAAIVVLRVSLTAFSSAASAPGCTPQTADGLFDPTETIAVWQNRTLTPPGAQNDSGLALEKSDPAAQVLGVNDNKWIEIDLGKQKLIAHEGGQVFTDSLISSGLGNRTPVGEYRIWYKIRSTKMEGGSRLNRTYYYLPNVPYAMFFFGSYGIHGTYWHSNFGHRMSHGCVNAPTSIAEKLFYWTDPPLTPGKSYVRSTAENPGTRVIVHN
ncbi:MAG: hypothetical protein UX91_C0006G0111 [Candidatus Amesbacteria bacterium GW2011_GWB1_47_19]|nr:MAG: hypothetical protein UW51_C0002G0112 [Candidatus Amesbacteria bacterium GW2011_GWA1_44_24]KKU31298.1 MAG: hypothetical protein UX46_C0006G0090 [Candidatus Amesbacteria bacterium GW2011_GWC1_46_24]KKU67049.1 MAG: hypothetical protein UX91_C0006G0111 [Candidatus Amesbacteria bacterium GW2011_GWB1_47_19]OGD04960.1 MAG: hypothetical protein A2379_04245 [Candidatus Amesbacteria bacterium RIFOXYB1_FULL_47_13]HBC72732.1 hypothetical protein [Candidatus Amesbacteria bacterium]